MATHVAHLVSENMSLKAEVARLTAAGGAKPSGSSGGSAAESRGRATAPSGSSSTTTPGKPRWEARGKKERDDRNLDAMASWRTGSTASAAVHMTAATHGAEKIVSAAAAGGVAAPAAPASS